MSNLPLDGNVQFMTIVATKMPFVARGRVGERIADVDLAGGAVVLAAI